jgi:excisionase family DNA binding protein
MDKLLTTEEVAALTRVSVHTVRFWRKHGTGPRGFRLGKRVVYSEHDVQAWLHERRSASAPARGAA